jgi:N utilization substance protein A
MDRETGDVKVYAQKTVVEEVYNDLLEISLEEARKINKKYQIGDIVDIEVTPKNFGRIAAQTAKQVVIQRIREAERNVIYEEFLSKETEVITGIVY